jgi:penicillin-binding protein 2
VLDASPDALGLLLGERTTLPDDVRLRDDAYGRTGIERTHDEVLRGRPGATVLARDAKGRTRATLLDVPAKDGQDVKLTIDVELQAAVEAALDAAVLRHGDGLSGGAAVLLDLRDGGVLVSASSPRYDPDSLGRDFDGLLADPRKPLLNRAVLAVPPASTFKALSAFALRPLGAPRRWTGPAASRASRPAGPPSAAARSSRASRASSATGSTGRSTCRRRSSAPATCSSSAPPTPWGSTPSKPVGRRRSGSAARWPACRASAGATSRRPPASPRGSPTPRRACPSGRSELGRTSFIDLAGQDLARRRAARAAWWLSACASDAAPRPGDGRNAFIGQGDVLLTPVQVAWLAATLAGRGRAARPRVDASRPVEWTHIPYDPAVLGRVREGLRRVVTNGTASSEAIGLREQGRGRQDGHRRARQGGPAPGLVHGLLPRERPDPGARVLVDRTPGHGGDVCGPVARAAIEAYDAAILGKSRR